MLLYITYKSKKKHQNLNTFHTKDNKHVNDPPQLNLDRNVVNANLSYIKFKKMIFQIPFKIQTALPISMVQPHTPISVRIEYISGH